MHSFAQTNIQLFNQLQDNGYSDDELVLIRNVYKFVMRLFAGYYRSSGKTFISHLVGTASILAYLKVSAMIVASGLMHAAYTNGDFGDGEKGISEAKREQVKRIVGYDVEEYVARYTAFKWNQETIAGIHSNIKIGNLDSVNRDVLLIRLANELEEHLDFGILYCGELKFNQYTAHNLELIVEISEMLGFTILANELKRVISETAKSKIFPPLANLYGQNESFCLFPQSHHQRHNNQRFSFKKILYYLLKMRQ